jgi:hypothetical protein
LNILFIMADQRSWDYLSCAARTRLSTPHIEAHAARGEQLRPYLRAVADLRPFAVLSRYGVARAWNELAAGHEYAMKSVIQRLRFPLEVMLVCVR